jgi:AhpD family alkylhydroperoxidase
MTELNNTERELVAIGAAIASNCVPCIEYHIPEARKAGLTDAQIGEAVRLADRVRQVPAKKVLDAAMALLGGALESAVTGGPAASCEDAATASAEQHPCCG